MHQLLRWANKREVARELTRRGFDVSGETLNRWVREEREMPAILERLVLDMYGLAGIAKEPLPEWAGAVAQDAAERAVTRLVSPELLARLPDFLGRLEAFLQQADEDAPVAPGSRGQA